MDRIKTKNNNGFVLLFAVTLAAILLSVALGVASIALKEVKFGTSAQDTNDAFLSADAGAECALFYDKSANNSFPVGGPAEALSCASAVPTFTAPGTYNFKVVGLGNKNTGCANVEVYKDNTVAPPLTTIKSTGYNVGDSSCISTDSNRVERQIQVSYFGNTQPTPPPASPSPTFRSSSQASTIGTLLDIDKPNGTAQNDVMLAFIAVRPENASIVAPIGWTLKRSTSGGLSGGDANKLLVYYKVASNSEPVNYRWSISSSSGFAGSILSFSNVNTADPIDAENGQEQNTTGLELAAPVVSSSVPNTMVLTAYEFASSATWTPPAGMTEVTDIASMTVPNGGGISLEVNYSTKTDIGPTGSNIASVSGDASSGVAYILILKP